MREASTALVFALVVGLGFSGAAPAQDVRDCGIRDWAIPNNPSVSGSTVRNVACRIRYVGSALRVLTAPQNGTLEIDAQGMIYRPNSGFVGRDTFRISSAARSTNFADFAIDVR